MSLKMIQELRQNKSNKKNSKRALEYLLTGPLVNLTPGAKLTGPFPLRTPLLHVER